MNFDEDEEYQMIRELVRDFAESTLAATISKRDDEQIAPTSEWQEFVELGLHGITVEEQYGGIPIDDVVEAILVEELA
jgi:alkylation response protein AidB-like acyl-CoA dehydrogenase